MIRYVTLGTNDLERSAKFYDDLLAQVGATRIMEEDDSFVAWSVTPKGPGLSVTKPYDGNPASVGNGVMVALFMESPQQVDSFYKKAIELGGTDEGKPGPRANFYAGYFRDLDGNKLNAICILDK